MTKTDSEIAQDQFDMEKAMICKVRGILEEKIPRGQRMSEWQPHGVHISTDLWTEYGEDGEKDCVSLNISFGGGRYVVTAIFVGKEKTGFAVEHFYSNNSWNFGEVSAQEYHTFKTARQVVKWITGAGPNVGRDVE